MYVHARSIGKSRVHTALIPLPGDYWDQVVQALKELQLMHIRWPNARGFFTRGYLAALNNLSSRAWDSKRMRLLHSEPDLSSTVVVDVENTVSNGMFFIDMLTDCSGEFSPRDRDYAWSLKEFLKLESAIGKGVIRLRPRYSTLTEAEQASDEAPYPTDGVIAMWPGTTTSRKMKVEKSMELRMGGDGELLTSDADVVLSGVSCPKGTQNGDILETRFKLCNGGRCITTKPLFERADKKSANSTSAVLGILSSFSYVRKDSEARRREALLWCEALKQGLVARALQHKDSRKVVMDVGTGIGQSLDLLYSNEGVSYLLVEPSPGRCEMLQRRAGVYAIVNVELSSITSDEDLMKYIKQEVAFVFATFSAHFVVAELYDICNYWSIPFIGCAYTYDGVDVGESLVHTLGVSMKRVTETECEVSWGGDEKYREPYTTL
ncbi:MAG: hypothetical protein M1829_005186 [Trizodia sp. TS-e1964]|nr:MAG: hypothetical protein M1829_005186 [Trizodia sp. TS-e1964]